MMGESNPKGTQRILNRKDRKERIEPRQSLRSLRSLWLNLPAPFAVELAGVLSRGRFRLGGDIQFDHHFLADEIVRLAFVFDVEIKAVDEELGLHPDFLVADRNLRREHDAFGHAMQREIAGHQIGIPVLLDLHRRERGGGILRDVEEILTLQMAGQLFGIRPRGIHVDSDGLAGQQLAVGHQETSGELLEAAVVAAGDFGSNESNG